MLRGTWREAAAELLGTFVLLVFGTASVAQVVLSGGRPARPLDPPLVGARRDDGDLRLGRRLRRAPQPRGHPRPRRASAASRGARSRPTSLAQTRGRLRRGRRHLPDLPRGLRPLRRRRAAGGGRASPRPASSPPTRSPSSARPGRLRRPGRRAPRCCCSGSSRSRDRRNAGPATGGPVLVGALVALIGMTFGFNAGYAINPARDLGPRLFTASRRLGRARSSAPATAGGGCRSWRPCLGGAPRRLRLRPADHAPPPAREGRELRAGARLLLAARSRRPCRRRAGSSSSR